MAEEPLPAGGSCLLGSINLAEFVTNPYTDNASIDFKALVSTVSNAVIALNEVLDEGMNLHPLEEQRIAVRNWRQIGLGTMGLADMLIKLKVIYGSEDSLGVIEHVFKTIANTAIAKSCSLAVEFGSYEKCEPDKLALSSFVKVVDVPNDILFDIEKYGLRNSQLLTCAPTGSVATMIGVSTGVEPVFAMKYNRRTQSLTSEDTYYEVYTPIAADYLMDHPSLPEYFVESKDIKPIDRIKVQSVIQKYIDASISSTINLPEKITVDEIYDIYMNAWKYGLKGVTVYRENCKRTGILTLDKPGEILSTRAPKRPKELPADYYQINSKGEQFIVLVGLLNDRPYEIFAFRPNMKINIKAHKGIITKISKMHYSFVSETVTIDNLQLANDNIEEKAATLYASMLLRHGVSIKYIIKTARKVNDNITSFSSAICRILAKYVPVEQTGEKCPECGSNLIREGGCIRCINCFYSKCE